MNRVVHFEIHAKDQDKIQKFYTDVFGWEIKKLGPDMGNYRLVTTGKNLPAETWPGINGGITVRDGAVPKGNEPVNAFVCTVSVENADASLKKIKAAGGTIAYDKMDVPTVGILAYCKDPEHNLFGILQPLQM